MNLTFTFPEEQTEYIPKLSSILETEVDEKYYIAEEKVQEIINQALKRLEPVKNVIIDDTYGYNGVRTYEDTCPTLRSSRQGLKTVEGITEICINDRGFINKEPQVSNIVPTLRAENHGNHPKVIEKAQSEVAATAAPQGRIAGWVNREDKLFAFKDDGKRGTVQEHVYLKPDYSIADACNTAHVQKILEPQQNLVLIVPEATKQGYAVACEGDAVNLSHLNSKTRRGRVGTQIANTLLTGCEQHVVQNYRVRKLTPTEYGRLQAFPMDTWKQVVSDSQAYKQFGNAVTVTTARAIALAIKAIFKNHP